MGDYSMNVYVVKGTMTAKFAVRVRAASMAEAEAEVLENYSDIDIFLDHITDNPEININDVSK